MGHVMKSLIETARLAAEVAKHEIAKLRAATTPGEPEYEMADDALLGVGWAVKRLNDLGAFKDGKPAAPSV